jgi:hypothetical protein
MLLARSDFNNPTRRRSAVQQLIIVREIPAEAAAAA